VAQGSVPTRSRVILTEFSAILQIFPMQMLAQWFMQAEVASFSDISELVINIHIPFRR
jgi:hypothetical protein